MTEDKEQKHISDLIDRMLAGDDISASGETTEEERQLLSMAAELMDGRALPDGRFEERLTLGMAKLKAADSVSDAVAAAGEKRRLLPGWLSMPRIAAVTAALVLGLGVIGLTGAIIRGGGPGSSTSSPALVTDAVTDSDVASREKSTGVSPVTGQTGAAQDSSGFSGPEAESAASGSAASSPSLPSSQRVIKTADYTIEVAQGEFDGKYSEIKAVAARYGGYVVSADARSYGEDLMRGTISIRVASSVDNFDRAQNDIDALGNVKSRKISGQDVTEEYVDLQSRLRNYEAQEAQMLALMQRAQTIEEILSVQSRLSEVQSQIEQIKGRITYMESRTDFATITVDLRETKDGGAQETGGTDWGFVESVEYAGWLAVQTFNFVIMAMGIILPLILMASLVYLLIRKLVQWRRVRKGSGPDRQA